MLPFCAVGRFDANCEAIEEFVREIKKSYVASNHYDSSISCKVYVYFAV